MTTRQLPPAEWPRLAGTELETVWPHLSAESAIVVVVEDGTGTIVGTWALMNILHAEGIWIAPAHRRRGAVARCLLREGGRLAATLGASHVMTAATTVRVGQYLRRLGAELVPGEHYVIPARSLVNE